MPHGSNWDGQDKMDFSNPDEVKPTRARAVPTPCALNICVLLTRCLPALSGQVLNVLNSLLWFFTSQCLAEETSLPGGSQVCYVVNCEAGY